MKLLLFSVLVLFASYSVSLGDTSPATNSPSNTPIVKTGKHQNMFLINMRFRDQWKQIAMGEKSGKISSQQVSSFKESLKTIHLKEREFLKQDGKSDLTSDQTSQLNQMLDANEASIPK
jgi:hypothetical protein